MPKVEVNIIAKIDDLSKRLEKAEGQMRDLGKESENTSKKMQQNLNKSTESVVKLGNALGIAFGGALVLRGLNKTLNVLREFETELANLRAITGMAADDMDYMKRKAIELSEASTRSAKEVVQAFKLVGSAKPELLKSADALAEVTKQAIILSEAGGISVPEAAMALTQALNQFGKSAANAAEFTDILATSQQKGSAFIQALSESMLNAGSTANALGLSFETTNAVLQGFAKGGLQGLRAGTAFSMIMSKLASQADKELNPEITDMNTLLDNLAKRNLSVAQANEMVGLEAGKYLLTLIDQRDIVKELNGALYEQGNALEQARINTDTMDQSLRNVGKNWDNFILSIKAGSGIVSKAIKYVADDMSNAFQQMGRVQRAEFEGLNRFAKWGLQIGSILDPGIRGLANRMLEASGEAEQLDEQMDALNETLGGETGAGAGTTVGLIAKLKEELKGLETQLVSAKSPEEIARLNREITALKDTLKDFSTLGIVADVKLPKVEDISESLAELEDKTFMDAVIGDEEESKKRLEGFFDWLTGKTLDEADEEIRIQQDKEGRRIALITETMNTVVSIFDAATNANIQAMNRELAAAEGDEKKQEAIKKKYAKKMQTLSVARTIISGAEGIVKTSANLGYPQAIPFQILQAIQTAAQIAIIKAQKFSKGVLDLRGPGTETSDSIPAWLSRRESVMTAEETKQYYPYLKAMKEGKFPVVGFEIAKVLEKGMVTNNLNYDNSKEIKELRMIREELKKRPFSSTYFENGKKIIKKGNITTRISLN